VVQSFNALARKFVNLRRPPRLTGRLARAKLRAGARCEGGGGRRRGSGEWDVSRRRRGRHHYKLDLPSTTHARALLPCRQLADKIPSAERGTREGAGGYGGRRVPHIIRGLVGLIERETHLSSRSGCSVMHVFHDCDRFPAPWHPLAQAAPSLVSS